MQSMTGYGKAEYNQNGINLVIEVKTVNNRFLDIVPKYPRVFLKFDDLIRKTIATKVSRGRLELFVNLRDTREQGKTCIVDLGLAKGYYDSYKKLKEAFPDVDDDYTLTSLMRAPDVVVEMFDSDDSVYENILTSVLSEALDNLNAMRHVEGEKLKEDLLGRMDEIARLLGLIEDLAPAVQADYRTKITTRVEEALNDVKIDESRILQEVAIFADKSNIDEEITRLKSHIGQFRSIVKGENCGRKLDFLVQEFNREANTICSKSNNISITDNALKLKCEIEKIREQIQNVE